MQIRDQVSCLGGASGPTIPRAVGTQPRCRAWEAPRTRRPLPLFAPGKPGLRAMGFRMSLVPGICLLAMVEELEC